MDSLIPQIFNIITGVVMLLLFIRFMMQLTQADPYNPIVRSTVQATHMVDVLSRVIPSVAHGRVNLAALVLMVLVRIIDLAGSNLLAGVTNMGPDALFVQLIFGLVGDFLWMCKILIYVSIFSSLIMLFTQQMTPFVMLVMQMTEPLYAPFRRILPDLGPIDLSPIIALLVIFVLRTLLAQAYGFLMPTLM